MIKYLTLLFTIGILFSGCCSPTPKEFSYSFIVERAGAYKLTFNVDHTKHYYINEQYLIFENRPDYKSPVRKEGVMSEADFNLFVELVRRSKLTKIKESHDFEQDDDEPLNNVIYHIVYTTEEEKKFISIQLNGTVKYSRLLVRLIDFSNQYIDKNRYPKD